MFNFLVPPLYLLPLEDKTKKGMANVLHLLPVKTKFRGTTNFAQNFTVEAETEICASDTTSSSTTVDKVKAHFRGRRLYGQRMNLPKGVVGTVVTIPMERTAGLKSNRAAASSEDEAGGKVADDYDPAFEQLEGLPKAKKARKLDPERGSNHVIDQFATVISWDHDREPTAQLRILTTLYPQIASAIHRQV